MISCRLGAIIASAFALAFSAQAQTTLRGNDFPPGEAATCKRFVLDPISDRLSGNCAYGEVLEAALAVQVLTGVTRWIEIFSASEARSSSRRRQ